MTDKFCGSLFKLVCHLSYIQPILILSFTSRFADLVNLFSVNTVNSAFDFVSVVKNTQWICFRVRKYAERWLKRERDSPNGLVSGTKSKAFSIIGLDLDSLMILSIKIRNTT